MADSVIGALRVNLGIDSAQFQSGLKNAQATLGNFGKAAGVALAAVATAAVAAGAAIGTAVKGAIDRADDMGKLAQSVGVSVEALSRLEYAGKLAGVSLDGLGTGLRKLSQSMVAVTTSATGPAASAFAALGINVQNADGTLRNSTAVLGEVADRFASMEDGATKTALAVQLFGKSGADLIPLLNAGSAGLAEMAAESDRLGLTISTGTAKAAEQFNDTLTRVGAIFEGIIAQLGAALLPALNYLSDALLDVASDSDFMTGFLEGVVDIFKIIVTAGAAVFATLKSIGQAVNALSTAAAQFQSGNWQNAAFLLEMGFKDIGKTAQDATAFIEGLWRAGEKTIEMPAWVNNKRPGGAPSVPIIGGVGGGGISKAAKDAGDATKLALEEANKAAEKLASTMESLGQSVGSSLRGLIDGTKEWSDVLIDIALVAARSLFTGFGGPTGSFLTSFASSLFGFKDGGSFRVGGSGGIDSQLVAFKASPNERVSITKPGDDMGGRSVVIQQSFPIQGAISSRDVLSMVQQGAAAAVNEVKSSLPGWQTELQRDGGIA